MLAALLAFVSLGRRAPCSRGAKGVRGRGRGGRHGAAAKYGRVSSAPRTTVAQGNAAESDDDADDEPGRLGDG